MKTSRPSKRGNPDSDLLPLFEYSNVINSSIDLNFILTTVLLTVLGKMLVSRGMILLRRDGQNFEVVVAKGVGEDRKGQVIHIESPPKTPRTIPEKSGSKTLPPVFAESRLQLVVPIITQQRVVGMLGLGERIGRKGYAGSDLDLIKSLVNLSASAIEKAVMLEQVREANRSLDRRYQELNTLFELSKEFNLVLDSQKVVRLLTFSLLGQVGVNRYAICLREKGSMQLVTSRLEDIPELHKAIQSLSDLKSSVATEELLKEKGRRVTAEHLMKASVRAVIPMHVQNQTKGLILLGDRLSGAEYSRADMEFLYSLGNLAIISIENARLFQETLEKQRLEDELKIAREIQQGLLPQALPVIEGFEIAAVNVSSKQVGGDYYDLVQRSGEEFVFAIGDVSGKGAPAALLMANVQAALRALAPMNYSLPEATARINDLTFMNTGGDKFITFFWGSVDGKTRMLRYVNAGHNLPFLIHRDGSLDRLSKGGLILGIMKTGTPYEEGVIQLVEGDTLFLFTDGVSEAMNPRGEDFTEERLETILKRISDLSAGDIIRSVKTEVEAFVGAAAQSDDITMLVLKVR